MTSISVLSRHTEGHLDVELNVSLNSSEGNSTLLTGIKNELGSTPCYYSQNFLNIGFGLVNNSNYVTSDFSEDDFFYCQSRYTF